MAALPEELAALGRRLAARRRFRAAGIRGFEGTLGGQPVAAAVVGDGEARARAGLEALLERRSFRRVLGLGVAGALAPGLGDGAVLAGAVVRCGGAPPQAPDAELLAAALACRGVQEGMLVTASRLVPDVPGKRALWRLAGQPTRATVDLESASFAEVAARRGLPYLVLRAVSDPADRELPAFLGRCCRADGSLDRTRIVLRATLAPWRLPALLGLARRVRRCARRLAEVAEQVLAACPP